MEGIRSDVFFINTPKYCHVTPNEHQVTHTLLVRDLVRTSSTLLQLESYLSHSTVKHGVILADALAVEIGTE